MPYTISQKILLAHTGKKDITPGEFIMAKIDFCFGNDITAPLAIEEFKKIGVKEVFDKDKVGLIPDHFAPAKDLKSAQQCKILKNFAKEFNIRYYFEIGEMGIEHALLPEQGLIMPGDLIIGADSHTCTHGALGAFATGVGSTDLAFAMAKGQVWLKVPESIKFIYKGKLKKWVGGKDLILFTIGKIGVDGANYKSMEFCGPVIDKLPMDDRFTMCNMAIEAGGKSGIIAADKIALKYLKDNKISAYGGKNYKIYKSDQEAKYAQINEHDISDLEPQVALPHLPSRVKAVSQLGRISIDQVVIGSCTNGRLSDLAVAAKILKGKKVNTRVRTLIFPATRKIYLDAVKKGLVEIFIKAGAVFSTPTCGPCLGGHMGILAEGERAVATTNRNFVGRMGDIKSEVYLSNPAVAAASAIKGYITHPEDI